MNHSFKKAMTALMLSALIVSSFSAVTASANNIQSVSQLSSSEEANASREVLTDEEEKEEGGG